MENYFQALGGKEALGKIVSAKKSTVSIDVNLKDTTLAESIEKMPNFSHSQYYSGTPKILTSEIYGNPQSWTLFLWKPFPTRYPKPAIPKIYIHEALFILDAYNEKRLTFLGAGTVMNIDAYTVKVKPLNSEKKPSKIYYFDKTSNLLIASRVETLPNNYIVYSDYRKINDVYFPHKNESFYTKELIASTQYKNVQFNIPMEDASFTPTETSGEPRRDKNSEYNKIEYVSNDIGNGSLDNLIQNFKGKRLIIDLWATWCGPCKFEFMKYDTELYSFLKSYNIEMLFISIDEQKKEEDWITDLRWFNLNGYHLLAGPKLVSSIRKEIYHNNPLNIPRCILVDEQGKIVFEDLGKPSGDQFKENIKKSFSQ
jgi:thiol-disulfide isomerase/thioredoxin